MRIALNSMWPCFRIDWVVSVLSCTRPARHWHLPRCGAPLHHVIRTVAAPCEQRPCCDLTTQDMARQDMAFRLEETSRNVDTIQHVVARQGTKRSMTSKLRWHKQYKNRVVRSALWGCFFFEGCFDSLLPNMVCNLGRNKENVGIVSGRATGFNLVKQPFQ